MIPATTANRSTASQRPATPMATALSPAAATAARKIPELTLVLVVMLLAPIRGVIPLVPLGHWGGSPVPG